MSDGDSLNDLERQALELLLDGDHSVLEGLRAQLELAAPRDREITDSGFRCHFTLPVAAPPLEVDKPFQILDLFGDIEGVQEPVGFILFVENGRMKTLECQVLSDESWPADPLLTRLYFVRPRQSGSAELDETPERDLAWALGPEAGLNEDKADITSIEPIPVPLPLDDTPDPEERGEEMLDMMNNVINPEETQNIDLARELAFAQTGLEMPDDDEDDGETLNEAHSRLVQAPTVLPTRRLMYLLAFNVFLATVLTIALVTIIPMATYLPPTDPATAFDPEFEPLKGVLIWTLITILIAGATGGALSNLRGVFKYQRIQASFPTALEAPFYTRPLTGALTGLLTFFAVNLLMEALTVGTAQLGWATLPGRMTYVALALIAGFLSQESLEKLQATARSVFSQS